jgi:hypothetical protein
VTEVSPKSRTVEPTKDEVREGNRPFSTRSLATQVSIESEIRIALPLCNRSDSSSVASTDEQVDSNKRRQCSYRQRRLSGKMLVAPFFGPPAAT